jgi:hypothetical protein
MKNRNTMTMTSATGVAYASMLLLSIGYLGIQMSETDQSFLMGMGLLFAMGVVVHITE